MFRYFFYVLNILSKYSSVRIIQSSNQAETAVLLVQQVDRSNIRNITSGSQPFLKIRLLQRWQALASYIRSYTLQSSN